MYTLEELRNILSPIAKKHGVRRVAVFGSVARGEANEISDVDLLIDAGAICSLLGLIAFRLDAEYALNTSVDVATNDGNDKDFLNHIRPDEANIYEQ